MDKNHVTSWSRPDAFHVRIQYNAKDDVVNLLECSVSLDSHMSPPHPPPVLMITSIIDRCKISKPDQSWKINYYYKEIRFMDTVVRDVFGSPGMKATRVSAWMIDSTGYRFFEWTPDVSVSTSYAIWIQCILFKKHVSVRSAFHGWRCSIDIDNDGLYHYEGDSIYYFTDVVRDQEPLLSSIHKIIRVCTPSLQDHSHRPSNKVPFSLIMPFRRERPKPGLYADEVRYPDKMHNFVQLVQNADASDDLAHVYEDNAAAIRDIKSRLRKIHDFLVHTRTRPHTRTHKPYNHASDWTNRIHGILENDHIERASDIALRLFGDDSYNLSGRPAGAGSGKSVRMLRSLGLKRMRNATV